MYEENVTKINENKDTYEVSMNDLRNSFLIVKRSIASY